MPSILETTTAFDGTFGVGDGVGLGDGVGVGLGDGAGLPEEGEDAGCPMGTVVIAFVAADLPPQPVSANTQTTEIVREEKNKNL